jgi:hypothetical protein
MEKTSDYTRNLATLAEKERLFKFTFFLHILFSCNHTKILLGAMLVVKSPINCDYPTDRLFVLNSSQIEFRFEKHRASSNIFFF